MSFHEESNKLVGASNFLAWKKRTNLNLIEDEVMEHVKGSITKPPKEEAQAHAKFMKGEVRPQKILIESIKDPLIPCVSKLETSKEIYDKPIELFSTSIAGEVISLRQELYRMKVSKGGGITSYSMRVSEIRDQLQELGERMSDKEMTTIVLNALPEEWGNFTSSIYGEKEATPFNDLWSLCKIEETRLKEKSDVGSNEKTRAYGTMAKRKGKFGKSGPQKRKKNMAKVQCYGRQDYGHHKRDCPKLKKDNKNKGREEAHVTEEVEDAEKKKSKKEEVEDLYYD